MTAFTPHTQVLDAQTAKTAHGDSRNEDQRLINALRYATIPCIKENLYRHYKRIHRRKRLFKSIFSNFQLLRNLICVFEMYKEPNDNVDG